MSALRDRCPVPTLHARRTGVRLGAAAGRAAGLCRSSGSVGTRPRWAGYCTPAVPHVPLHVGYTAPRGGAGTASAARRRAACRKTAAPARVPEKQSPRRRGSRCTQERAHLVVCRTSSGCPRGTSRQPTKGVPLVGSEVLLDQLGPQKPLAIGGLGATSSPGSGDPGPQNSRWFHGGGPMELQSLARARSRPFLRKWPDTYCSAHWIRQGIPEILQSACSGRPPVGRWGGQPNEHSNRSTADLVKS